MQYDFQAFLDRTGEITEWLKGMYRNIQSGKVTPSLLERVTIETYGANVALSHCASITLEDPKTLLVSPYDTSLLPSIETRLREQLPSLGLSIGDTSIRVIAKDTTAEQRVLLERTARENMEEAKKSVRMAREKVLGDIKRKKTEGELSDDEEFAVKKKLQEQVDTINETLATMYQTKLHDLQT